MRRILAASILMGGCFSPEVIRQQLAARASPKIDCPAGSITVGKHDTHLRPTGQYSSSAVTIWQASGCGRDHICEYDGETEVVLCKETEISRVETLEQVAIDRLSLETGCPRERVSLVKNAGWTNGQERAYRLEACGKPYICTTAPSRTECRAALQ